MNEYFVRSLLPAPLREDDIAARLGVDPKTVRRWLNVRVPYPRNRASIAELVDADEGELWPEVGGPLAAPMRPEELGRFTRIGGPYRGRFGPAARSAEQEIAILAYSACSSPRNGHPPHPCR